MRYPHEGLKGGFIYKTVPHITLKSIANNPEIDEIYERMYPTMAAASSGRAETSGSLRTSSAQRNVSLAKISITSTFAIVVYNTD